MPDSDTSLRLAALLAPDGLVTWDAPVSRDEAVRALVARVVPTAPTLTAPQVLARLAERDALGSTAIGEGVDLPHTRMASVRRPAFAVGRPRGGVEGDADGTEVVWLLLLPPGAAGLGTTAQVARACHDATFRDALRAAEDADDLRTALARWEAAHDAPSAPWAI